MSERLKQIEESRRRGEYGKYESEAIEYLFSEIHRLTEELSTARNDLAICGGVLGECREKEIKKQARKEAFGVCIEIVKRWEKSKWFNLFSAHRQPTALELIRDIESARDMKCPCEIGEIEGCPQDASCPEMKGER